MSWYTDVSFWTKKPLVIQAYNDQDESFDYLPERTCNVIQHGSLVIEESVPPSFRCWSCSECSYGWHVSDYDKPYSYCPNCGAKVVE